VCNAGNKSALEAEMAVAIKMLEGDKPQSSKRAIAKKFGTDDEPDEEPAIKNVSIFLRKILLLNSGSLNGQITKFRNQLVPLFIFKSTKLF
jgi:hypothetical protein